MSRLSLPLLDLPRDASSVDADADANADVDTDTDTDMVDAPVRPRVRGECESGGPLSIRPCPWATCRHHLWPELGAQPDPADDLEIADMGERKLPTCVLDVIDARPDEEEITDEEIAQTLHLDEDTVIEIAHSVLERDELRDAMAIAVDDDEEDVGLDTALVEAVVSLAAEEGCELAADHFDLELPLVKRLYRRHMIERLRLEHDLEAPDLEPSVGVSIVAEVLEIAARKDPQVALWHEVEAERKAEEKAQKQAAKAHAETQAQVPILPGTTPQK